MGLKTISTMCLGPSFQQTKAISTLKALNPTSTLQDPLRLQGPGLSVPRLKEVSESFRVTAEKELQHKNSLALALNAPEGVWSLSRLGCS